MTTRTRGLGSVYQRGETWWIKFYVDGKAKRESSGSEKQSKAVNLLKRRLEELSAGRYVPDAGKVTLAELLTMLGVDATAKGNRSRPKLGHLCKAFDVKATKADDGTVTYSEGWLARAITTDRVRAYEADRLLAGAARATVNQELAALRRTFTLAVEAGRVVTRPVIKTPDPGNARKGFVTEKQFAAVRDALPQHVQGVWEFCYLTGWRGKSEVLPLRWAQVDWKARVIRLEDSKNGEAREFPFGAYPPLVALLERQLASGEPVSSAHVFHNAGRPIPYETWNDARIKATTAARVEAITHDLRRTAVRNLERAGVSRSVAMSLTGHKTEAVYRRYAIVDSSAQREGVAKLAKSQVGHSTGTISEGGAS
jgi:integrase